MLRLFFCLLIVTCFGRTFSQNRFYLRPVIDSKICKANSDFVKPISPHYFEFKFKPFVWTGGLDLGLMIGYQFNKNRTRIETGLQQMRTVSAWELSFSEYIPASNGGAFIKSNLGSIGGPRGILFPALLSTQIFYWDSLKLNRAKSFSLHCNLLLGINVYHKNERKYLYTIDKSVLLSPTTNMTVESYRYYAPSPRYIIPEFGLSLDVRKKQKEWFTLAMYYMLRIGRYGLTSQHLFARITDVSAGSSILYHYALSSRGNGLIIEISKKIFYPTPKRAATFIKE